MVPSNKLDLCVRAFLEYYRSKFKKYTWVCEYAEKLIQTNPEASLQFVIELLATSQNEQEIAYVASGPLEELLHRHILTIRNEIKLQIEENPLMRTAIRYVWAPDKSPVQIFLQSIHGGSVEKLPLEDNICQPKAVDE